MGSRSMKLTGETRSNLSAADTNPWLTSSKALHKAESDFTKALTKC